MNRTMKQNKLVAAICQHFADMVDNFDGCGEYEDYTSLFEALKIATEKLPSEVEREDVEGWLNPHLDAIHEDWEGYNGK